MQNKMKRVLNLSADKVNGYVFKDSPSIYWSWWHVLATVAFVVLLVFALVAPFNKAHAASLPAGERIECRIEISNPFTKETRTTFKAYDSSKIKEVGDDGIAIRIIKVAGDEQVPEATITMSSGELFAVANDNIYRGICRNGKTVKVLK